MKLVKNISYDFSILKTPKELVKFLNENVEKLGPITTWGLATVMHQKHYGRQVVITKQLSDLLKETDFRCEDVEIKDVPFPFPHLEVFFEDPNLPTFLMSRNTPSDNVILNLGGNITCSDSGYVFYFEVQEKDGENDCKTASLKDDDKITKIIETEKLSGEDKQKIYPPIALFLAACFYSSIDKGARIPIKGRKDYRQGGKPNVKGRPKMDATRWVILPKHHNDLSIYKSDAEKKNGSKKSIHLRRGHLRVYRSERYKNSIGKTQYIGPMIVGSKTPKNNVKYKITA